MKTDKNSRTNHASGAPAHPEQSAPDTNPSRIVRNCRELRRAIAAGISEYSIVLDRGFHSRKTVMVLSSRRFRILNHLDKTFQDVTGREIYTQTNVGTALRLGVFVVEGQGHE